MTHIVRHGCFLRRQNKVSNFCSRMAVSGKIHRGARIGLNAIICSRSLIRTRKSFSTFQIKSRIFSSDLQQLQLRCTNLRDPVFLYRTHATCTLGGEGKWEQPTGHDTGIVVWHPTVKKKVPLILNEKKIAKWYGLGK